MGREVDKTIISAKKLCTRIEKIGSHPVRGARLTYLAEGLRTSGVELGYPVGFLLPTFGDEA